MAILDILYPSGDGVPNPQHESKIWTLANKHMVRKVGGGWHKPTQMRHVRCEIMPGKEDVFREAVEATGYRTREPT